MDKIATLLGLFFIGCVAEVEPMAAPAPWVCDMGTTEVPAGWPTPADALDIWPVEPSKTCLQQAETLKFAKVDHATAQKACDARGCIFECSGSPVIIVSEKAPQVFTPAHELAHWLYSCSGLGMSDRNHGDGLFNDTIAGIQASQEATEPEFTDAEIAWKRRMELLTDLPRLDSRQVAIAVEIANAELLAQGYEPGVVEVPVYLGTPDEIAELAGKPAFGWTPGAIYMIHAENLCDRPENYDGRMFGWVLTHELLHTVGFEHSVEMTALTNAVWDRWQDHCTSGR